MGLLSLVLATTLAASPAPASANEDAVDTAWAASTQKLLASLRASPSPRERALSTLIYVPNGPEESAIRGTLLRKAAQDAPGDRLVQWLWALADEQGSGCDAAHPCPERGAALARLEPDNAAAWFPTAPRGRESQWRAAQAEALARMRGADHADFLFGEMVDALMTVYERYPADGLSRQSAGVGLRAEFPAGGPLSAGTVSAVAAIAQAAALALPFSGVLESCKAEVKAHPDAAMAKDCRHVVRLLAQSQTVSERSIGLAYLRAFGAPDPEAERQLAWTQYWFITKFRTLIPSSAEFDRYTTDLRSNRSEIKAIELLFQRQGISLTPPDGWQKPGLSPGARATPDPAPTR